MISTNTAVVTLLKFVKKSYGKVQSKRQKKKSLLLKLIVFFRLILKFIYHHSFPEILTTPLVTQTSESVRSWATLKGTEKMSLLNKS